MKPHRPLLVIESVEDRVLPSGLGLTQPDSYHVGAADALVSTMVQPASTVVWNASDPVSAYASSLPSGGIALNHALSDDANGTGPDGTAASGRETSGAIQNLDLNGAGIGGYFNPSESFEPIIVTTLFTSSGWVLEVFNFTGAADPMFDAASTQPAASQTASDASDLSVDGITASKPDGLPSGPVGASEDSNVSMAPSFADGLQGPPVPSQFLAAVPSSINTTVATVSRDAADAHATLDAATNFLASLSTQVSTAVLPATFVGLMAPVVPPSMSFSIRATDSNATSAKPFAAPLAESAADAELPAITVATDPPADGPIPALATIDVSALGDQVSSVLSSVGGLDPNIELPEPDVYAWIVATGLMSAGAGYAVWVGRKSPQPARIPLARGSLAGWEDRE